MLDFNNVPKRRTKIYTEQFTCRVSPEFKNVEIKLKALHADVAEIARLALEDAFRKSLERLSSEAS